MDENTYKPSEHRPKAPRIRLLSFPNNTPPKSRLISSSRKAQVRNMYVLATLNFLQLSLHPTLRSTVGIECSRGSVGFPLHFLRIKETSINATVLRLRHCPVFWLYLCCEARDCLLWLWRRTPDSLRQLRGRRLNTA